MRKKIDDLTWNELAILRGAPYESPRAIESYAQKDRRVVNALLRAKLLERSDDGLVRCTDEGTTQAAPLTFREVNMHATYPRALVRLAAEVVLANEPRASADYRAHVVELAARVASPVGRRRRR